MSFSSESSAMRESSSLFPSAASLLSDKFAFFTSVLGALFYIFMGNEGDVCVCVFRPILAGNSTWNFYGPTRSERPQIKFIARPVHTLAGRVVLISTNLYILKDVPTEASFPDLLSSLSPRNGPSVYFDCVSFRYNFWDLFCSFLYVLFFIEVDFVVIFFIFLNKILIDSRVAFKFLFENANENAGTFRECSIAFIVRWSS